MNQLGLFDVSPAPEVAAGGDTVKPETIAVKEFQPKSIEPQNLAPLGTIVVALPRPMPWAIVRGLMCPQLYGDALVPQPGQVIAICGSKEWDESLAARLSAKNPVPAVADHTIGIIAIAKYRSSVVGTNTDALSCDVEWRITDVERIPAVEWLGTGVWMASDALQSQIDKAVESRNERAQEWADIGSQYFLNLMSKLAVSTLPLAVIRAEIDRAAKFRNEYQQFKLNTEK